MKIRFTFIPKLSSDKQQFFVAKSRGFHTMLIIMLTLSIFPHAVYAAPVAVGTGCQWVTLDQLMRDWSDSEGDGTQYVEKMAMSVEYRPPHTKGDRDFNGHGPAYYARVDVYLHPSLIYAVVSMKAWEIDDSGYAMWDYTTVEGTSPTLTIFDPIDYWYIESVEATRDFANYVRPPATSANAYGMAAIKARRDNNGHGEERFDGQAWSFGPLIQHITITGDTDGEDPGRTKVEVGTAIRQIRLCPKNPNWEMNMDRLGGDYYGFALQTPDPNLCQQACNGDGRCKAWTYLKPEWSQNGRPMCFLKNPVPGPVNSNCCVSGVK